MRLFLRILLWGVGGIVALLVVGWLSLQRGDIPWATLESRYANSASRYMDLPGGLHVHYRDQGNPNGPTLVMVHGFGASLHAWEPWVARLGDRYRIISLDLPAHGLTRAPSTYAMSLDNNAEVVEALTQRLHVGPFVAVGNSMGGGVAWTLALRHPDRVRGLVLVDAVGGPMQRGGNRDTPPIFRVLGSPIGRALIRNMDTRGLVEPSLRGAYVDPALVTPALVSRYVELSRAPGHRDIILGGRGGGPQAPDTSRFAQIHVPTLVLHGDADVVIPLASGRALAALIPGSRLIVYPGAGHVPMEQIPDRSAADVRAFLAPLDPPPPAAN